MNIKEATLQLFLKHVIIIYKDNSPSYNLYGQSLIGILTGRNWGKDSIVSINIRKENQDFLIPVEDIETIEAL